MGIRLQAKHYSKKITFVSGAILMLFWRFVFLLIKHCVSATKPATKAGEKLVTIYDRAQKRRLLQKRGRFARL